MRYHGNCRLLPVLPAVLVLFLHGGPLWSQPVVSPVSLRALRPETPVYTEREREALPVVGCAEGDLPEDCSRAIFHTPGATTLPAGRDNGNRSSRGYESEKPQQPSVSLQNPEPPNEFQRFVQSSTGHLLPIYGASLFERVPSTFSPLDRAPIPLDYVVGPGDEIDVRAWGQVNLNQRFTVDRTGDIFLPEVGRIPVAGLKFDQLQPAVQSAMRRVFRNFDVDVNMGQLRAIQIFVVGQARRPGSYTVSSLSTLVNAIFASGGPSTRGSLRNIELRRGGKLVTKFDMYQLLLRGDTLKDARLMPGDVIFIPDAGPRVAISGSVATPAIYELKGDTTLNDVLGYAGGLSQSAARQKAVLERFDQQSRLLSDNIELTSEGLAMHPMNGDIIRILPIVPQFDRTVTLRGNVADPIRFPWHPGMRVSDLIPDPGVLLTRDYWNARNALLRRHHAEPLRKPKAALSNAGASLAGAVFDEQPTPQREFVRQTEIQPLAPAIDWNYATIERLNHKDLSTQLLSFNLRAAIMAHDPSADLILEPNDIVTVFSDADITVPKLEQTRYVRVEGEVALAGVYSVRPGETLRDIIAKAGGLTRNAYLYGAQFTRESTRKEQQRRFADYLSSLERDMAQRNSAPSMAGPASRSAPDDAEQAGQRQLIERLRATPVTGRIVLNLRPDSRTADALPALPLENGDTLLVPSRPATVNVLGTVYNQGSFLYNPADRLRDYLAESGGAARYADRKHIFVIRADGSVVAKDSRSKLIGNDFDELPMYPGDTIIVPAYIKKGAVFNNVLSWSQLVGGMGVSAAAINALR